MSLCIMHPQHGHRAFLFPGGLKLKVEMPEFMIGEWFVDQISKFCVGFNSFSQGHHGYYWLEEIARLWRLYYPNQHVSNPTICESPINVKSQRAKSHQNYFYGSWSPLAPYTLCLWSSEAFAVLEMIAVSFDSPDNCNSWDILSYFSASWHILSWSNPFDPSGGTMWSKIILCSPV